MKNEKTARRADKKTLWAVCAVLLAAVALLIGFTVQSAGRKAAPGKYTWYDAFDTVITLTVFGDADIAAFEEQLYRLDTVFDAYEPHDGVAGVYALNHAGGEWVSVEEELYDLLVRCQELYARMPGKLNIMAGSLTGLWKAHREEGVSVPGTDTIAHAMAHMDFGALELDSGRARITDPEARLDVGAVAKGYAVELLAQALYTKTPNFLLDAGGNVRTGEGPLDGRENWSVGVQNPEGGESLLAIMNLKNTSAVTSGGVQRFYEVDGVRYHHLIDPEAGVPGRENMQTTVITEDSFLADWLSTELFLLPYEEGRALVDSLENVECIWVTGEGETVMTDGAKSFLMEADQ